MANYSIVSNARFTPFSFDQMVKPFQMYGEYYAQEEALASQLAEEAATWGQKANETTDPVTYQKYKSYEADLNRQSDRLLRQGLTPGLRADLQKMKKRYATEINPIKDAYNWKVLQMQNQAEGRAKGVVYEGDASTTSLDTYVSNPTLIYGSADSTAGYARVANAAQAIAKGLSEAKITGQLDSYTKSLLIRSGYDANDVTNSVSQAMADLQGVLNGTLSLNSKAGKVVQELLQNETKASGIGDWKDLGAKQEYLSKVSPALYNLIGASTTTPTEDFGAREGLKYKHTLGSIAAQGAETRKTQDHAAEIAERQAQNEHARKLELIEKTGSVAGTRPLGSGSGSGRGTGSKGGGTEYGYDRPNVYFSKATTSPITKTSDGTLKLGSDALGNYTRLTIKRAASNANDIEIWSGNRKLASYNASSDNKSDGILYWDPSSKKYIARHGGAELGGVLKDLTATDIRNFARYVAENPGSENQYTYGVQSGKLFSIQNDAQRVTKSLAQSTALMQQLWADAGYDFSGTDYDSSGDLNLW